MRVAVMQGRLLPPVNGRVQAFPAGRWREEFPLAAAAGIDAIEWIYEVFGEGVNPLGTDEGIGAMLALSAQHGVAVESLCADWFMDRPLLRGDATERIARQGKLTWLLARAAAAGIRHVVLPFVDASAIVGPEDEAGLVETLRAVLPAAEATGVEIHLETALGPREFAALLERLPHPLIRVNYDCGNSASLGHGPAAEFAAYGSRVGSVHVKDRARGGGTVPLGAGAADFAAARAGLRSARYRGLFTLQVARGPAGGEVDLARANRAAAEALLA